MNTIERISVLFGGLLFGFGLAFSGAAQPEIVLSFLYLTDLGLLFVIGAGLFVTVLSYNVLPRILTSPLFSKSFSPKVRESISSRTIVGAVVFGVGWGLTGLCPGTVLAGLGTGNLPLLYGVLGMFIGTYLYGHFRRQT